MTAPLETFRFEIPGDPKAKTRPRAAVVQGRAMIYDTKANTEATSWARLQIEIAMDDQRDRFPLEGPVSLRMTFFLPRPKSVKPAKRPLPTTRPDLDNLEKLVKDAATRAGLWRDDCQVCHVSTWKVYADHCEPRTVVEVDPIHVRGGPPSPQQVSLLHSSWNDEEF